MSCPPLYILRHGLSQGNAEGMVCGSGMDVPLAPLGVEQARLAGSFLRTQAIGRLFASPMLRTRQTTEALGLGLEPSWHQELLEMNFGIYEGQNFKVLPEEDKLPFMWAHPSRRHPEGESFDDMRERLRKFFEAHLLSPSLQTPLLIVAHGSCLRAFLWLLCPAQKAEIPERRFGNCEVRRIENWRTLGGTFETVFSAEDAAATR